MMRDWGREKTSTIYADSSAPLATAKRQGAGKLRHIHVSSLWIQDVQDREGTEFHKVLGTENPADLMTKHLTREKINEAMKRICQSVREGRAETSLDIQGKSGGDKGQKGKAQATLEIRSQTHQATEAHARAGLRDTNIGNRIQPNQRP